MSSKNDCLSTAEPENPHGGGSLHTSIFVDPLDRIYEPSEDSDWEAAFRDSIRPASISSIPASSTLASSTLAPSIPASSTPAPSISWRGEDSSDNMDHQFKNTSIHSKENLTIQIDENSQVIDLHVPVISIPSDSLALAWSQEFISTSSPRYNSIPLYLAEGREDPEKDEGIDEPSSPLSSSQGSTMISGHTMDHQTSPQDHLIYSRDPQTITQDPQTSSLEPQPEPEAFIDGCSILQWVINDSDDMTPNILDSNFLASATITSGAFTQSQATTATFITPIKSDEPIEPIAGPSFSPSTVVKSETEDPDWELDTMSSPPVSRKRGRPAKPPGSRTITPRPPPRTSFVVTDLDLSDSSVTMTDDEISAAKWRRMRDLNNLASRRCRETRKERAEAAGRELQGLQERNFRLKRKVAKMEEEMKILKRRILTDVRTASSRAARPVADQRTNRGMEGNFIEMLLSGASGDLPDIDTLWSGRK